MMVALLIFFLAGCAGTPAQAPTPSLTPSPALIITPRPSLTLPPATPTVPLVGSPTPTPHPTDSNSLKPLLRSPAEAANQGAHNYRYNCYAWTPCTCLVVVPGQIEVSFVFSARSVELRAGDFSQTFLWLTNDVYQNTLGALTTQLTFFEDGFELYTIIDQRSCTQERYTIRPDQP
jgi:hypothetical protein